MRHFTRLHMRQMVALVLGFILIGQNATSLAASAEEESTPAQVAYGAGSVLGTLVYSPFKASFCILGAIASGFTFPFGGAETAGKVAGTTCRGTWVINPDVLKGRERVEFIGKPSRSQTASSR